MKLEVGKTYVARNGDLVEIVGCSGSVEYPFIGKGGGSYMPDGGYIDTMTETRLDLIREHTPTTPTNPSDTYTAAYLAATIMGADHARATDIAERLGDLV